MHMHHHDIIDVTRVLVQHPSFHESIGFHMTAMFVDALMANGYAVRGEYAYNDMSKVMHE